MRDTVPRTACRMRSIAACVFYAEPFRGCFSKAISKSGDSLRLPGPVSNFVTKTSLASTSFQRNRLLPSRRTIGGGDKRPLGYGTPTWTLEAYRCGASVASSRTIRLTPWVSVWGPIPGWYSAPVRTLAACGRRRSIRLMEVAVSWIRSTSCKLTLIWRSLNAIRPRLCNQPFRGLHTERLRVGSDYRLHDAGSSEYGNASLFGPQPRRCWSRRWNLRSICPVQEESSGLPRLACDKRVLQRSQGRNNPVYDALGPRACADQSPDISPQ